MSLLKRCKAGEERAWGELFSVRARQIFRWAVLLGLNEADAEDAAQDVLVTAARRIASCQAEEAMTCWLYQITRRIVANHRRKATLRRWFWSREPDDDAAAFVHHNATDRAYEIDARRCLRRLARDQGEVLVMMEIVGLTREECARVLGVPPGTVASRHRRARQAFQREWALAGAAGPERQAEP